ncbi:MAG: hypothetical protein C0609_08305, partial [Deltaproteobacteria bacterium]
RRRGYITRIVHQINTCYAEACYDACAVMIRRLVEVLIIEAFEANGDGDKIKDSDDNYLMLDALASKALATYSSKLGRVTKAALNKKKFKELGDQSAHSWKYNAHRQDIDDVKTSLRHFCTEFLYLCGLKD